MKLSFRSHQKSLFRFLAVWVTIPVLFLSACIPPCPPVEPVDLPEFILGTSQGGSNVIPLLSELGVKWMRGTVTWRSVEPEIEFAELTVEQVDAQPEMIAEYIQSHNWSASDALLAAMKAGGLEPMMIVGHGYTGTLPYFGGERLTPDRIGRENYLGHIYLFARAAVERYNGDGEMDAPGGQVVKFWQLENELNQAFFTALWGWRTPSFLDALGSAWRSWDFVTQLLETLSRAVEVEDPEALTTVNFHTDVPEEINSGFLLPSWQKSIRQWVDLVDVIGIDAYPNYYSPEPVKGEVLGELVAEASEMGCGKPVVVVETGYPTGPSERGYTEQGQATYIQEAFQASVAAGAKGFFLFGVKTGEAHGTVITPEDVANLEYLAELFDQGDFFALLTFALQNVEYLEDHFSEVLQTVEPYWGLVRSDGTHKPAWDVFQSIANP